MAPAHDPSSEAAGDPGPAVGDATQHDEALAPDRLGLQSGDRIGPYTLVRPLGAGGMAVVWEAGRNDGTFDRRVALKLPRQQLWRQGHAERFARERQLLARLEHPNIARLYDAGIAPAGSPLEGTPFLVLEFVEGESLIACCDRQRLGIRARLALFAQVLDAVQYAHSRLVLHRDLKPANILVTAEGKVRLLDFGIGKLLGEAEANADTSVTRLTGKPYTPDFASPEQVRGEEPTTASDVYALGVVLYLLLCGVPPYVAADGALDQIEWAILDVEPAPPSARVEAAAAESRGLGPAALRRELRGELDTIVLKALDKSPARRYETVAALSEDLRRHLAGERVLARPDSWLYRTRKYAMRNKVVAGSAVAILLALGSGMGIALWQAERARQALAQAMQLAERNAAVNNFLGTMLSGSTLTEHLTVGQLLTESEGTIDRQFARDPATRAVVLAMLARLYTDANLFARAAPLWARSRADAASSGQTDLIAVSNCLGAVNDAGMGHGDGALARVRAALELPGLGAHERAQCLSAASEVGYLLGDVAGALRDAQAALATLAEVADRYPMDRAEMTGWLGTLWAFNRRDDLAEQLHLAALEQLHALGRERDALAVVETNNYAVLMTRTRPREAVARLLDMRRRFARSAAGTPMPAHLLINYGFALLNAGDPREALAIADDPVLRGDGHEWREMQPQREMVRARAYLDLGDYAAARRALDSAAALLAASPSLVVPPASMKNIQARLLLLEGRLPEARRLLEDQLRSASNGPESRANANHLLAQVALAQGQVDFAEQLARNNLRKAIAAQGQAPWSFSTAREWDVLGQVLARRHDLSGARDAFLRAREQFAHTVLPQSRALAQIDRRLATDLAER